jgi:hypothetical protein
MVAAGNLKAFNPAVMQATSGLMPGLPNMVGNLVRPIKETKIQLLL